MIQIFSADNNVVGLFKDYGDLFKHITSLENTKLMDSTRFPSDIWTFVIFTNKRLSCIYPKILERSFSKIGKEAVEQELDLLEISKGDYHNPLQIPVTENVNVAELRKKWCQEYCDSHDYTLVEMNNNFDHISDSKDQTIPANTMNSIPSYLDLATNKLAAC
jgi:hypothetical protein